MFLKAPLAAKPVGAGGMARLGISSWIAIEDVLPSKLVMPLANLTIPDHTARPNKKQRRQIHRFKKKSQIDE